jgi:pimeloyl-ACP methyl ester carboxylesterase
MNDNIGGNRGSRRARLPAVVAAAAVAATGLIAALAVPAIFATASPGTTPRTGITTGATPQVPVLNWTPCDNGFQCATAQVPLDYRHPDGTKISIAVIRHVATDPAERIGSLFINGGGPSEQIDGFLAAYPSIPATLRERFDIITFDPRGFGYSTAVRCFPTAAAEHNFLAALPPFPVGTKQEATWEQTSARFDALCAKRNGNLLDHDTSADVARDMNLLREAVGDPVLNYLGESYGSGLGAIYANLFPATVGRIVLDGNVNPVAWTTPDGSLTTFLRLESDEGNAANMTAFLKLCGQTTTAACAFSAGTPAATRAKWNTLLSRLRQHLVTIGSPPQAYTYADTIASVPLGQVSQWQQGASLLQQLWVASAGSTPAPAATAGGGIPARGAAPGPRVSVYTGLEQSLAVLCSDSPNPRNLSAYAADAKLAYARSGGVGLEWLWTTEACAQWPGNGAQDQYTGPWNRPTAHTILLLGNTGDTDLPYQDALAMQHDLARARLLTVQGYGHTEYSNPSTCALNYELSYLQTGALPSEDTVCKENAAPFPAP